MHEWKKEVHLAMRTFLFFFSFVTVSQLNLDHSVLALCVSTLDGSVPYAPFNGTWIHVQFFYFYFFFVFGCVWSQEKIDVSQCFSTSSGLITVLKNN